MNPYVDAGDLIHSATSGLLPIAYRFERAFLFEERLRGAHPWPKLLRAAQNCQGILEASIDWPQPSGPVRAYKWQSGVVSVTAGEMLKLCFDHLEQSVERFVEVAAAIDQGETCFDDEQLAVTRNLLSDLWIIPLDDLPQLVIDAHEYAGDTWVILPKAFLRSHHVLDCSRDVFATRIEEKGIRVHPEDAPSNKKQSIRVSKQSLIDTTIWKTADRRRLLDLWKAEEAQKPASNRQN